MNSYELLTQKIPKRDTSRWGVREISLARAWEALCACELFVGDLERLSPFPNNSNAGFFPVIPALSVQIVNPPYTPE